MEASTAQCAKHHFDRAVAVCGQCGLTFCPACLVYAFGPDKAPLCIPCALTVGGVRRAVSTPKVSWREKRARRKALAEQSAVAAEANLERALALANADAGEQDAPSTTSMDDAAGDIRAAQPEETFDWSAPFGEEAQAPPPSANESMPPMEIDWSAPFDAPFERSSLAD